MIKKVGSISRINIEENDSRRYFLETNRLLLKVPKLTDLEKLIELRSDAEVRKYTGEGGPSNKSAS